MGVVVPWCAKIAGDPHSLMNIKNELFLIDRMTASIACRCRAVGSNFKEDGRKLNKSIF